MFSCFSRQLIRPSTSLPSPLGFPELVLAAELEVQSASVPSVLKRPALEWASVFSPDDPYLDSTLLHSLLTHSIGESFDVVLAPVHTTFGLAKQQTIPRFVIDELTSLVTFANEPPLVDRAWSNFDHVWSLSMTPCQRATAATTKATIHVGGRIILSERGLLSPVELSCRHSDPVWQEYARGLSALGAKAYIRLRREIQ